MTSGANAVSQLHAADRQRDLGGRHRRQPILGITNGVHPPTWLGGPHPRAVPGAGRRPRPPRRRAPERPLLGAPRPHLRRAALGRPPGAEAGARLLRPGPAARPAGRVTASRPTSWPSVAEALDPGIMTIGFARRFATYKRAALLFTRRGAAGAAAVGRGPARPDRVRGQGPSRRPAGPARHPGHLRAQPVGAAQGPRVHPRGLRHPRRAATWCRASTSGSTTRAGRSRHRAPAA